jgi:hypothetical protein
VQRLEQRVADGQERDEPEQRPGAAAVGGQPEGDRPSGLPLDDPDADDALSECLTVGRFHEHRRKQDCEPGQRPHELVGARGLMAEGQVGPDRPRPQQGDTGEGHVDGGRDDPGLG